MSNLTDLTGLTSIASAAGALMLLLPGVVGIARPRQAILIAAVFVLMLIPFGGMPLAAYVRGVTGDLSITTLVLLWCVLLRPWLEKPSQRNNSSSSLKVIQGGDKRARKTVQEVRLGASAEANTVALIKWNWNMQSRHTLLILIALAALILYPMALGIGTFDPYRLGYSNPLFVAALLLIAVIAWFSKFYLIALCIALATLAWAMGWYESDNLWDYLLDPWVAIYALAAVVSRVTRLKYARVLP